MHAKAAIPFLVAMMLVTGVCNTLLTKYQDNQCVHNCSAPNPKDRKNFEQPVWQTAQMFVGESGCWLVVLISFLYKRFFKPAGARDGYEPVAAQSSTANGINGGDADEEDSEDTSALAKPLEPVGHERRPLEGWRVILLALPASCDIIATTLMNVGLLFVAASIYQMTRGALVLFVGVFSVLFLKSRLAVYKWAALVIVVAGVALVGLAGIVENRHDRSLPGHNNPPSAHGGTDMLHTSLKAIRDFVDPNVAVAIDKDVAFKTALGIVMIFLAQVFTASQFVLEESIMHKFTLTPIAVVGWEGVFGLLVTVIGMVIGHFAYGRTPAGQGGYFDVTTGWREISQNRVIAYSSILIMISIGGFNFFGLSVTRTVSATSRSTIDTCRTLFIWVVSLGLGWESFKWLQVVGFGLLVYGTFLFNDIVKPPGVVHRYSTAGEDRREVTPAAPAYTDS